MAAQVNYSRLLLNFLFIVVAVCSPLLVFLGAYAVLISDSGSISALASRTATPWLAEPPIANAEALAASSEVIDYVRGGPEIARKSYFREEELSHLSDVRRVILKSFLLLKILAAVIIFSLVGAFALTRSSAAARLCFFRKSLFAAGAGTLAMAILAFAAFLGFDYFFTAFHLVFFQDSQWQFPYSFAIVNLFTPGFFAAMARNIVAASSAVAVVLLAAGFALARFKVGLKHET